MAKAQKKRKMPAKAQPGSPLKVAFECYEAGDALLARKAARQVLAMAPEERARLESEAKKMARKLFPPDENRPAPTVEDVAREIAARTEVPPKAYLFAPVAAAIIGLMVLLAALRH